MNNDTTRLALLCFARDCAREAQRAEQLGQSKYAAGMRATALRYLAGAKVLRPPSIVDLETARRQSVARAYAKVLTSGLH